MYAFSRICNLQCHSTSSSSLPPLSPVTACLCPSPLSALSFEGKTYLAFEGHFVIKKHFKISSSCFSTVASPLLDNNPFSPSPFTDPDLELLLVDGSVVAHSTAKQAKIKVDENRSGLSDVGIASLLSIDKNGVKYAHLCFLCTPKITLIEFFAASLSLYISAHNGAKKIKLFTDDYTTSNRLNKCKKYAEGLESFEEMFSSWYDDGDVQELGENTQANYCGVDDFSQFFNIDFIIENMRMVGITNVEIKHICRSQNFVADELLAVGKIMLEKFYHRRPRTVHPYDDFLKIAQGNATYMRRIRKFEYIKEEFLNSLLGSDSYVKKGPKKSAPKSKLDHTAVQEISISRLDIRVGIITKAEKHPHSNFLYVFGVDVGEGQQRTVVSAFSKYIPIEKLQERMVCVLCNVKTDNILGIKSHAKIFAVSNADHTKVELVEPPQSASVGERIKVSGFEGTPDAVLPNQKVWKAIQRDLHTNKDLVACYKDLPFTTSAGVCKVLTISDGAIYK